MAVLMAEDSAHFEVDERGRAAAGVEGGIGLQKVP